MGTIGVLKARNLKAKDINGKSDPYVKVWLMFGEKRVEKKKTPIYKCNLNPIFNASFEFDVPWEQIRDCALDVQVMDFGFSDFQIFGLFGFLDFRIFGFFECL